MPVPSTITDLSETAASNSPAGSDSIGTNADNYIRALAAILREETAGDYNDVASATTTDIGAEATRHIRITGATTITGLGTVAAGVERFVRFAGALTLTHNGTSLILPGGANITTAANDCMLAVSLGSGNWIVPIYQKAAGYLSLAGGTLTGALTLPACTTSIPSVNAPHGTAPSSPSNGDIWTTTSGVFARINGATEQLDVGSNDTNWASYTPTITNGTGGISNYTATGFWRRQGDNLQLRGQVSFSGTPAAFSEIIISINGNTIDTAKLPSSLTQLAIGSGMAADAGSAFHPLVAIYESTTTINLKVVNAGGSYASTASLTQAVPFTFGSGDYINWYAEVPISGWAV